MATAVKAKEKPKAKPGRKLKGKPKNDKLIRYKAIAVYPRLQPLTVTVGPKKKAAKLRPVKREKDFAFGYDLEIDPNYPMVAGTHVTVQGTVTDNGQLTWWYDDPDGNTSVPTAVAPAASATGFTWSVAFDVTDGPGDYLFSIEGTYTDPLFGFSFDIIVSAWFTV
jgi:hypothetical protein